MGTQPGFISARLLKSDDGTRITAIMLWESQEEFTAARQIPNFQNFLESEFLEVVSSEVHVYSKFVEVPGVLHKHKHKE
ncbi:MAG: antibiotic biosynthesis monooxygenase [Rhizonema sp. PD37]|nr:antibiotic biosynthesis monooxygenase [Rhizonema sp. PD37]